MKQLLPLMFFAVSLANATINPIRVQSEPNDVYVVYSSDHPSASDLPLWAHAMSGFAESPEQSSATTALKPKTHRGVVRTVAYPVRHPVKSIKKTVHVAAYPVTHPVKAAKGVWKAVW